MILRNSEHISVEGQHGLWRVIDEDWYQLTPDVNGKALTYREHVFLLEHESHREEMACLIVNQDGLLLMDDVWNGFKDLEDGGWERSQSG